MYIVAETNGWFSQRRTRYEKDGQGNCIVTKDYHNDNGETFREKHNMDKDAEKRIRESYNKSSGGYSVAWSNCQHASLAAFNAATKSN